MYIFLVVHDDVPSGHTQMDFMYAMCTTCHTHNQQIFAEVKRCATCGGKDLVFYNGALPMDSCQLQMLVEDSMS